MPLTATDKAQRVLLFDDHPEQGMLEAMKAGADAAGWGELDFFDITDALENLRRPRVTALICTLGVRALGQEIFPAEALFEVRDGLDVPRMIVSSHPEADMFVRSESSDLLVPSEDLKHVTDEVTRWLGCLTHIYAQQN